MPKQSRSDLHNTIEELRRELEAEKERLAQLEEEVQTLKTAKEGAEAESERLESELKSLEETMVVPLKNELDEAELKRLRAADEERQVWLEKEKRWLKKEQRLDHMEKEVQRLRELLEERHATRTSSPTGSVDRPSTKEGSSADAAGAGDTGTTPSLESRLGWHSLNVPEIPSFSGEVTTEETDTVNDWIDRLETVAVAFEWDEKTQVGSYGKQAHWSCFVLPVMQFRGETIVFSVEGSADATLHCCAYSVSTESLISP